MSLENLSQLTFNIDASCNSEYLEDRIPKLSKVRRVIITPQVSVIITLPAVVLFNGGLGGEEV